jgi:hypothetical protein
MSAMNASDKATSRIIVGGIGRATRNLSTMFGQAGTFVLETRICEVHLMLVRSLLCFALALACAPAAQAALLVGAESNAEIVNSTVSEAGQHEALVRMKLQGTQVVRANFGWNEIAAACAGQTSEALADPDNACYNWRLVDSLVASSSALGLQPLVSFTRTPAWASGSLDPMYMGETDAQFTRVMDFYVSFHRAAAARYRTGSPHGTIRYWTVHNEPNSAQFWKPRPSAERYGLLYARTAVAIRQAHPGALIAAGPTNPNGMPPYGIPPLTFIKRTVPVIERNLPGTLATKRTYLRYWAHNPYPNPKSQPTVPNPAHPDSIGLARMSRLIAQLDSMPLTRGAHVWATEFGWETAGPGPTVSQARQAQFIAEAFDMLGALGRVDIGINYGVVDPLDPADWQSGTWTASGQAKASMAMMQRMVSVPQAGLAGSVKAGQLVRIWGRSNIARTSGRLMYRRAGGVWKAVPGQRRQADGSIRASLRLARGSWQLATRDALGQGPVRQVRAL